MQSRSSKPDPNEIIHECETCPLAERRAFLGHLFATIAAIAATLGFSRTSNALAALPVSATRALSSAGPLRSYPIPATDCVQVDRDTQVIVVRWQKAIYAFNLSCPHQNTALRWEEAEGRFQCPKHHSKYQRSGEFIEGRATRSMDRFRVRIEGSTIVVDLAAFIRQDQDPTGWAAAVARLA